MTKLGIAIILTLYLMSCEPQTRKDKTQSIETKVSMDTSQIAVMSAKYPPWVFKNAEPTELSMEELGAIEIALTKCVSVFNAQKDGRIYGVNEYNREVPIDKRGYLIDLPRYKRQYFPVINKQGEKEVWINCLCSDILEFYKRHEWLKDWNWKKTYQRFNDGGNCFFYLKVNLTTGKYYDFMTNGSETIEEENQ